MSYAQPTSPTTSDPETGQVNRPEHTAASSATDTAGVIAPPPLIYLGALGIGFGLDAMSGRGSLPSRVRIPSDPH